MFTPFCPIKVKFDYPRYINGPINSITKWINFVVQRGVESLDLHLITTSWTTVDHYILKLPLKLPISIVTYKTLVVLKLYNFDVENGFSLVVLPSLKVLDLQQIRFPKLRDFMLFLADCPILEELTIYDLYFNSEESLTCDDWNSFYLSNLKIAEIDFFHRHLTLKAVQNVSSLCFEFDPADLYEEVTWISNIWVDPDFVPECLSLHLRTCNLLNFYGLEAELELARYILKNAKVLQNMTIWKRRKPEIYSLLSSCPKASPTCKITCHDFTETTEITIYSNYQSASMPNGLSNETTEKNNDDDDNDEGSNDDDSDDNDDSSNNNDDDDSDDNDDGSNDNDSDDNYSY